jgi:hypothetical protein
MKLTYKTIKLLSLWFVILPLGSLAGGIHKITVTNKHPNQSFTLGSAVLKHVNMSMDFQQSPAANLPPLSSTDAVFNYIDPSNELAAYMVSIVYLDQSGNKACWFTMNMVPQAVQPSRKDKSTMAYAHNATATKLGNANCSYQIQGHHTTFTISK